MTPAKQDDPRRRKPDISRARKLLNWSPQVGSIKNTGWAVLRTQEEEIEI